MYNGGFKVYQQQQGFTLLELLITMTVVALLLAIVVPQFGTAYSGARFQQQVRQLTLTLNRARHSANASGEIVRLKLNQEQRQISDESGDILFSWDTGDQLQFVNAAEEPVSGYILFIPGAGSNGAQLLLTQTDEQQQREARLNVHWLTGGVSHERL